jgi:drug/metabolite transporter (DMT)-like permease
MTRTSWILLFSLGSIWGGTFFCTEILLLTMTPFHIVFFRVSLGALAMLVFIHLRGQRLPTNWQNWRWFLMMGFFNNALPLPALFLASSILPAGWPQSSIPSRPLSRW